MKLVVQLRASASEHLTFTKKLTDDQRAMYTLIHPKYISFRKKRCTADISRKTKTLLTPITSAPCRWSPIYTLLYHRTPCLWYNRIRFDTREGTRLERFLTNAAPKTEFRLQKLSFSPILDIIGSTESWHLMNQIG